MLAADKGIVNHEGSDVLINTDEGNDFIYNDSARITINSGIGDDHISCGSLSSFSVYNAGARNDSIYNDGSAVTGSSGSILLKNAKTKIVTINNSKSFEER